MTCSSGSSPNQDTQKSRVLSLNLYFYFKNYILYLDICVNLRYLLKKEIGFKVFTKFIFLYVLKLYKYTINLF